MADKALVRTDYWNRVTGAVRSGETRRDETVTDVESFLLPYSQALTAGLHLWGVADGLSVDAAENQPGLTVSPGVAIDARGRLIALRVGGLAVVDPDIDPDNAVNLATVAVDSAGLSMATADRSGSFYLTIHYLEVASQGLLGSAPVLVHAPWLRLINGDGFDDAGSDVVLSKVDLTGGAVSGLSGGLRRHAAVPASRLVLRRPRTRASGALTVDHAPAGELAARGDGGVTLRVQGESATPTVAFTVDGTGNIGIGTAEQPLQRKVHVEDSEVHSGGAGGGFSFADRSHGSFVENPDAGQRWRWYSQDGSARLWSGVDQLSVAANGHIGIGADANQAQRILHVEGTEVHSGGPGGGFSFADRSTATFVESPTAGERWVWYSQQGSARLWSGADRLTISAAGEGGGLDVARRMRVRQGGDSSAGIWFFQSAPQRDRAFVGMADDERVGFWGNTGAGWSVTMHTGSGTLAANRGIVATGVGAFAPAVKANGSIGVWAEGSIGVYAASAQFAAHFAGDVRVVGTLTKSTLQFEIDHPLDPANRFLRHSAIESDEMKNLYDGVVELDAEGRAEVVLPDWFEALNEQFRYQLTSIGAAAPNLHVSDELHNGRVVIAGGPPHVKVCWLVTGIRHDAYAKAHPLQVDTAKSQQEAGLFLHPHLHDQPAERSLATLVGHAEAT